MKKIETKFLKDKFFSFKRTI